MTKPDYDHSIMNIANSVLNYYGAVPHHATLPIVDQLLEKNYKNVVLFVMDGMGINVLERNLPKTAFLRKHIMAEISSVYPCTTTAATTSILTGKTPGEHGWIGWSCYFKEVDKCIDLFTSQESGTEKPAAKENQSYQYMPYDSILTVLESQVKTYGVSPFAKYYANTLEGICKHLKNLCGNEERKFIYAYYHQPDQKMHKSGVGSGCIKRMLADYDKKLETCVNSLSDTLFLITADHGMTDIVMKCVEDYPTIQNALLRHICVEPRCCSFYVKKEYIADFPQIFTSIFGDKFILFEHQEFMQSGLLGNGILHVKTADFVGDYVAVAVSDLALWYKDKNGQYKNFKGAHAGLTKEELTVPLIVIET